MLGGSTGGWREILRRKSIEAGVRKSNYGGWHSGPDLFSWELAEIKKLEAQIKSVVARMVAVETRQRKFSYKLALSGWANVNGPGQHNGYHNHPGHHWSGVYYVRAHALPDDPLPRAGELQFYDPRGSINMVKHPGSPSNYLRVTPSPGLLVIFPSWLCHSVNPFLSEVMRISIAFNVHVADFEATKASDADSGQVNEVIDDSEMKK